MKDLILKLLHLTNGKPLNTPFAGLGTIFTLHRVISGETSVYNNIIEISEFKFIKMIQISGSFLIVIKQQNMQKVNI